MDPVINPRLAQLEKENADLKAEKERIAREANESIIKEREKLHAAGRQISETQYQLEEKERSRTELSQANVRLHSEGVAQQRRADKAEAARDEAEKGKQLGMQQAE